VTDLRAEASHTWGITGPPGSGEKPQLENLNSTACHRE